MKSGQKQTGRRGNRGCDPDALIVFIERQIAVRQRALAQLRASIEEIEKAEEAIRKKIAEAKTKPEQKGKSNP